MSLNAPLPLDVELTVEQLREKSARLGFTVTNKETAELLATGYFVVVTADKNTGKATQIPREFADKLKPLCQADFIRDADS